MVISFLVAAILLLSSLCVAAMIYRLIKQPEVVLSTLTTVKLACSGVLAFIADTLGVGSFAVNVAMAKLLGTFSDDELPAVNNGAQVIPGTLSSLFFMRVFAVDLTTLVTLILGTCLGGVIGGLLASRVSKQAIRGTMIISFALIILLLLADQLHLVPIGGNLNALTHAKLLIGFCGMVACGMLSSFGIGLFVLVQSILFLLGVAPMVAFPIMTASGAMQQPLTTLVFLKYDKIPMKRMLILSLAGCIGVLLTIPVFKYLTVTGLHTLLLMILLYNFVAMSRAYWRHRVAMQPAAGEVSLVEPEHA